MAYGHPSGRGYLIIPLRATEMAERVLNHPKHCHDSRAYNHDREERKSRVASDDGDGYRLACR